MILAAAAKVASEKIADNTKTRENYLTALNTVEKINDAKEEALKIKITNYGYTDTRGEDAINEVLNDIVNKAISSNLTTVNSIKNELISEGVRSLANDVKRYPSPSTSQVQSTIYLLPLVNLREPLLKRLRRHLPRFTMKE